MITDCPHRTASGFREEHGTFLEVVADAADVDAARRSLYHYVTEQQYQTHFDDRNFSNSEMTVIRDCARVLRSVLGRSSDLRAAQNRDVVSILPDGTRLYEFHPWEKNVVERDSYIGQDVPLLTYLERLASIGENPADYSSIWYYF